MYAKAGIEDDSLSKLTLLLMAVERPHELAITIFTNHPRDDDPIAVQPATLLRFRLDVDWMPDEM
jgi:hypothetical protein